MRLTLNLLKHSHRWLFKTLWETEKSKYILTPLKKPKALEKDGTEIISAAELLNYNFFQQEKPKLEEPKYQETYYEVKKSTSLIEGELQALILTNSQPFYHFPTIIKTETSTVEDDLLQEIILHANKYDATMEKLPRRINPNLPIWRCKAEYGIPNYKIALITIKNLLQLCEAEAIEQNFNLDQCRIIYDVPFTSEFQYKEKEIVINDTQDVVIYSNSLLADFADGKLIDASISYQHKSIFPLAPTIDIPPVPRNNQSLLLKSSHNYNGFNPQTFVICFNDTLSITQHRAIDLLFCHSNAIAIARNIYGEDVVRLPKPISIQCVSTNGISFNFTFFQLNTLNLFGEVKNLAWFDSDNYLFKKIIPTRSMLRNTKYQDYDKHIFDKLYSVFCNGFSKNKQI